MPRVDTWMHGPGDPIATFINPAPVAALATLLGPTVKASATPQVATVAAAASVRTPAVNVSQSSSGAPRISNGQLTANGARIKMAGVAVWGIKDRITTTGSTAANCYTNRAGICSAIRAMGCNHIRLRLLASDYGDTTFYASKAAELQQIQDWVNAAKAQQLYTVICWWDALDVMGTNWPTQFSNAFTMMTDVVNMLGADPWVIYEPWNEPTGPVTFAGWQTAMRGTIDLFRSTLNWPGVLVMDPPGWSHRYSASDFSSLEAYDAGKAINGGVHQIAFAKHDYGNETSDNSTFAGWTGNNGGTTTWDMASSHVVWETEFGTHNGSGDGTHTSWASAFGTMLEGRLAGTTQPSFAGFTGFLWSWVDSNTMTSALPSTRTAWGDAFANIITPPSSGFVVRDATNTGPTGTLTSLAGNFNITTAGTVIQNRLISGSIGIMADNVSILNCRINGFVSIGRPYTLPGGQDLAAVHNPIIRDCELIGSGGGGSGILGVSDVDGIYQRNNIHDWENGGTFWTSTRAQILDSYIWHSQTAGGGHLDGLEIYVVKGGIIIRGNAIRQDVAQNAAAPLNITPTGDNFTGTVLVENNLIQSANPVYVVLGDDSQGPGGITAVFNNNRFIPDNSSNYFSLRNTSGLSHYSGTGNTNFNTGAAVPVG